MKEVSKNIFSKEIWQSLGGAEAYLDQISFVEEGNLPDVYPVTDLAAGSIATAHLAVAELVERYYQQIPSIKIDRRLSSFWFDRTIRPEKWQMPAAWDSLAGDYKASDEWIRLHTNVPHHRTAVESILGKHNDKESVSKAVRQWKAAELEEAIIFAGGCAAVMMSVEEWRHHPQGSALANDPLVHITTIHNNSEPTTWQPAPDKPLAGLKVLDLTRVLAGPVCTRFLAGYGADVLRIDPPDWNEPGLVPDVTLGKKCTRLDLKRASDRKVFEALLSSADILVHGYRAGALEGLGYDENARRAIAPQLIDISFNAYGWTGPWRCRRGFDSLVQMSAGIAHAGMRWQGINRPKPLSVQALDHATGYILAATAIRGVTLREKGQLITAKMSLAKTAMMLTDAGDAFFQGNLLLPENNTDLSAHIEDTSWGRARRLRPPAIIDGIKMHWRYPSSLLGSSPASWDIFLA